MNETHRVCNPSHQTFYSEEKFDWSNLPISFIFHLRSGGGIVLHDCVGVSESRERAVVNFALYLLKDFLECSSA
jgi:hypothetical protein